MAKDGKVERSLSLQPLSWQQNTPQTAAENGASLLEVQCGECLSIGTGERPGGRETSRPAGRHRKLSNNINNCTAPRRAESSLAISSCRRRLSVLIDDRPFDWGDIVATTDRPAAAIAGAPRALSVSVATRRYFG